MAKLIDYIQTNHQVIDKLLKVGVISLTVKQQVEIYNYHKSTEYIKSKTQRVTNTAEAMKVSENTVRRALNEMKKVI